MTGEPQPKTAGTLYVLSGPSGVGKGTIRAKLFSQLTSRYSYSISCTTRPPRPGERDGVDYRFISEADFLRRVENGEFLEWANVHGHRYGTLRSDVEDLLSQGVDVFLEIDVQGACQVKKVMPEAVTIFIAPPTLEDLERRLRGRGTETEEAIRRRLAAASDELAMEDSYDLVVVNDTVEQAANKLREFITSRRGKGAEIK